MCEAWVWSLALIKDACIHSRKHAQVSALSRASRSGCFAARYNGEACKLCTQEGQKRMTSPGFFLASQLQKKVLLSHISNT